MAALWLRYTASAPIVVFVLLLHHILPWVADHLSGSSLLRAEGETLVSWQPFCAARGNRVSLLKHDRPLDPPVPALSRDRRPIIMSSCPNGTGFSVASVVFLIVRA